MIKILLVIATFYANSFVGKKTSSGDIFSQKSMTCATLDYPQGSLLNISYKGRYIIVRVNDRCKKHGIVDLSKSAFKKLTSLNKGRIKVNIKIIARS